MSGVNDILLYLFGLKSCIGGTENGERPTGNMTMISAFLSLGSGTISLSLKGTKSQVALKNGKIQLLKYKLDNCQHIKMYIMTRSLSKIFKYS